MKKVKNVLSLMLLTFIISSFKVPLQSSYGPWRTTSCFRGIDFSVKRNEYNESAKKYDWSVKFRNRYNNDVSFSCVLKESSISSAKTTDRVTVKANSEGGNSWFLVADANSVNVFIDKLRFGKDDWGTAYEPCDN